VRDARRCQSRGLTDTFPALSKDPAAIEHATPSHISEAKATDH
jgi:hypothetical protein